MSLPVDNPDRPVPGLLRRLTAILYDGFLLVSLWMIGAALWLPFTGGEAVEPGNLSFRVYLLVIALAFFGGFWIHGGRTLGMQAWRLRLVTRHGGPVTWRHVLKRFGAALLSWLPLGLGYLWVIVDRDGLAWHDRLSGTRLVVERRKP